MYPTSSNTVYPKTLSWLIVPTAATAFALVLAIAASAQEVDGDFEGETQYVDKEGNARDIKEPSNRERKKVDDLFAVGKASGKDEEQAFEDVAHYYINALTLKKNIEVLPDKRKELKTKYLGRSGTKNRTVTDLHTRLNELTLSICRKVAEDPKYPRAVRYNCVLMIGELDSEENLPGTANSTVPWADATTALVEIARDEKQHVALRLGALVGLKRHAMLGVAPSVQPQLAESLLGILATPIGDVTNPDGQIWLRWRAGDVLHDAIQKKVPVDQPKFAAALLARIDEERMPNWARAKLAGDLGKLNGESVPPAQLPQAARSLAGLMLAICQTSPFAAEAEEPQKSKEDESTKKGADKSDKKGSDKDGNKDDKSPADALAAEPPSDAVQKVNAEEMMWQFSQIRAALYGKEVATSREKGPDAALGLRAAAPDDAAKTMIDKTVAHIDELVPVLAGVPDAKDVAKLPEKLRSAVDELEDLLGSSATEEEEAPAAAKPVAGRSRPPAGNAPAEASATGK